MTTDREQLKKRIVQEAFDLPPEERAAFVDEQCGSDGEMARAVWDLLRADQEAGRFLGGLGDTIQTGADGDLAPDLPEGTVLDSRYAIGSLLGEGGFGRVYRAKQTEPVTRDVALKVLKLGMNSTEIVRRFNDERQALAVMDHPAIASVYDGGCTPDGRPYFVMELVDGDRITKYCDAHKLSIRERLALFRRVCDAIQHAHQKGVIHRDIKPANILVQAIDGEHVPKVIDFGIAKAIDPRTMEQEAFTAEGRILGTPEYMSPEQAQPRQNDIDTRSDVYAMGALLYELLAGAPPFDGEMLRGRQVQELHRIIREETPPKLSTRLSDLRDTVGSIAASRSIEPGSLDKTLQGDLNWIVMKALEKDRDRRYDSASAFGEDIQRYLEDQPVQAGPPTRSYRIQKFVRRHRVGVGITAVFAALLIGGTVAISLGFVRALRAEQLQREITSELVKINSFYGRLIGGSWADGDVSHDTTVTELLETLEPRIENADSPFVRAALSKTYGRYVMVRGGLGRARPYLEAAYEQFDKPLRINEMPEIRVDHFWAARDLVLIYIGLGEAELAASMYEEAKALFERAPGLDGGDRVSLDMLGIELVALDDPDGAIALYTDLLKRMIDITETDARATVSANIHKAIGELHRDERRDREAVLAFDRAIAAIEPELGLDHPRIVDLRDWRIASLLRVDDPPYEEIIAEADRVIMLGLAHGGIGDNNYGSSSGSKGVALMRLGRYAEAVESFLNGRGSLNAQLEMSADDTERADFEWAIAVSTFNIAKSQIVSGDPEAGLAEIEPLYERWASDESDTGLFASLVRAYTGIALVEIDRGGDAIGMLISARNGLQGVQSRVDDLNRVNAAIDRMSNEGPQE